MSGVASLPRISNQHESAWARSSAVCPQTPCGHYESSCLRSQPGHVVTFPPIRLPVSQHSVNPRIGSSQTGLKRHNKRGWLCPNRPIRHVVTAASHSCHLGSEIPKTKSRNAILQVQMPMIASYESLETADVFPWNGATLEDEMTELTAQNGFLGRSLVGQTECATARPLLWNGLKQKGNAIVLSEATMAILQKRSTEGQVKSDSSFKLPPRVTLTDAKREAWLKGLANPLTPLRLLSRSIPHGVRGRTLLDHCLSKKVPHLRTTWLAKCVGANEIRAFKRKGTGSVFGAGGEMKWVRDWTMNVEQFMEAIIKGCGEKDWIGNMQYGITLTSQFLSADLIDNDHYINWLINAIGLTSLGSLCAWLLVLASCLARVVEQARYTRHLILVLSRRLQEAISSISMSPPASTVAQLSQLLDRIFLATPFWFVYNARESLFEKHLSGFNKDKIFRPSTRTNCIVKEVLLSPNAFDAHERHDLTLHRHLRTKLNAFHARCRRKDALECLKLTNDHRLLIRYAVQWSSAVSVFTVSRIYSTVSLMRIWSEVGVKVEACMLSLLNHLDGFTLDSMDVICKLLSELMHCRLFSVGKYCQQLMASGQLTAAGDIARQAKHLHIYLLQCLPLGSETSTISGLRLALLSRASGSRPNLQRLRYQWHCDIKALLSSTHFRPRQEPLTGIQNRITLCSTASRDAIARDMLQLLLNDYRTNDEEPKSVTNSTFPGRHPCIHMPLATLQNACSLFISLGEFRHLKHLLHASVHLASSEGLLFVLDILNRNFCVLRVLKGWQTLVLSVCSRMSSLEAMRHLNQQHLKSATDLNARLLSANTASKTLASVIESLANRLTQSNGPDSGSPSRVRYHAELAIIDDIEVQIAGGRPLDKFLHDRVINICTKFLGREDAPLNSLARLLDLLHTLNIIQPSIFHESLENWLIGELSEATKGRASDILMFLVCQDICSLRFLAECILSLAPAQEHNNHASPALLALLDALMGPLPVTQAAVGRFYRLHDQKASLLCEEPSLILKVIRQACPTMMGIRASETSNSEPLRKFAALLWEACESEFEHGGLNEEDSLMPWVGACLLKLELIDHPGRSSSDQLMKDLRQLTLSSAGRCCLVVDFIFRANDPDHETLRRLTVDCLIADISRATDDRVSLWVCLVSGVSARSANMIWVDLERRYFSEANKGLSILQDAAGLGRIYQACVNRYSGKLAQSPIHNFTGVASDLILSLEARNGGQVIQPTAIVILRTLLKTLTPHHQDMDLTKDTRCLTILSCLCRLYAMLAAPQSASYRVVLLQVLGVLIESSSGEDSVQLSPTKQPKFQTLVRMLRFLGSHSQIRETDALVKVPRLTLESALNASGLAGGAQIHGRSTHQRSWEMLYGAAPNVAENDTAINLRLFGTRKAVL